MDLRPTADQQALQAGTRELLTRRFGRDRLREAVEAPALDRALWRELGAAGFFALRLPEADGGVGLGLPDAVLVFEAVSYTHARWWRDSCWRGWCRGWRRGSGWRGCAMRGGVGSVCGNTLGTAMS